MKSLIQSDNNRWYCIENDGTISQLVSVPAEKFYTLSNLPGDRRPERLAALSHSGIADVICVEATDSTRWLMLVYTEPNKSPTKLLQMTD